MKSIMKIFHKEFNSFFDSPAAWLFLGAFLVSSLFIFFWAEAFFARNIADMKPLFQWMPILLIFLVAALTMRSWSEERRAGTLESLLTSPTSPLQLVMGKFLASLALVALSLLLTLPLPVTIAFLGPLDWGPVIGGYVASLFLAAAYIAIGLYMSARTDNPIVALILTVAVSGLFYLLGSPLLTSLFGHHIGEILSKLGTGSRFDSITRGVLDLRDLTYYVSIMGIFLTLNLFTLEKFRWADNTGKLTHRRWGFLVALAVANFILLNLWLNPIGWARIDLTQGKIYSLSPATKQYLHQLQEPLLIRGYFSAKSHPLLEPLVPQIKDILKEYKVAGGKNVSVEFIDPHTDQALEQEAAEKYGIRPVPFRMASRYQSGVVNSYFNLVVAYGDQYQTLSFEDLIEVKGDGEGEPEVLLNNPEYAITQAVRKVANAYQAGGNIFASLQKPVQFHAYISDDSKLPNTLKDLKKTLKSTLDEISQEAAGKFKVDFADPDANGGTLAKKLRSDFGLAPQIASLFDPKPFWFYMLIEGQGETLQVPLPAKLDGKQDKATLKKSIQAAVQRMAPGYLKTVAIVTPPTPAMNPMMGAMGAMPGSKHFRDLRDALAENVRLRETDLKDGHVPTDTDMLLVLSPKDLDDKQLFAIDQFLMKGGSVLITSGAFDVSITDSLTAHKQHSGLQDWLKHNGLTLADSMVLDPQDATLPVPVRRQLGPLSVREIRMMPYPHFPDIREDGLNKENPITASLGQLTLNWASPVEVDKEKNTGREVTELVHSSAASWTSDSLNVLPDYQRYPDTGFKPEDQRSSQLLAVALKGRFESFFKGKQSPLLADSSAKDSNKEPPENKDTTDKAESKSSKDKAEDKTVVSSIIEHSSDSARIILVSSNQFANDETLALASQGQGSRYTRPLEFVQNTIDWALDDTGLTAIRSRAQFARTLRPLEHSSQLFWEYLNYALAILGLLSVGIWRWQVRRKKHLHYNNILAKV